MSQDEMQKEIFKILDEWGVESGELAKKYFSDGLDSHPDEFKAIRDKYVDRIRELGVKYGITPKTENKE
jgi:hypothetical protein